MAQALSRQMAERAASLAVDRRDWTHEQWVEDAERLMDAVDGAVTSLVNGHVMALLTEAVRNKQGAGLHHPDPICAAHHQHLSPQHTCAGPLLYRCATCARTSPQPCRTWRTLTGKDTPDA